MSLQQLLELQKEISTWVPAVQEITEEQGGLCDGSVNGPWQQHTPGLPEGKSRDEGSGKVGGEKNTNW